ncbi:MAG TPA: hypothetical protein DCL44_07835 [Elusimicrobia bacterium]|nr:hypothetical protein [Elusimicrobiota bacterium]
MKTRLIVLSAVMSFVATASAGTAFETLINTSSGSQTLPVAKVAVISMVASPSSLLDSVLMAMHDQPGTAEKLVKWLRARKGVVELREIGREISAYSWLGGVASDRNIPAVYISPLAMEPFSYRYLAVLIAREAGELMLSNFPESAEKRYMVASRMSETFFELGGSRIMISDIDGHSDAKVEESIRLWVENDPSGGVYVLSQRGFKTLKDLEDSLSAEYERLIMLEQAIDQMLAVPNDSNRPSLQAEMDKTMADASAVLVKLEAVKAAGAQFEQFAKEETDWMWDHQSSLR